MNTKGMVTSRRRSRTRSKTLSVVVPAVRARRLASWITGPSAVGSEKGMPSSTRSAPAAAMARTAATGAGAGQRKGVKHAVFQLDQSFGGSTGRLHVGAGQIEHIR